RRRHTRSYGDCSSDVCSSDLFHRGAVAALGPEEPHEVLSDEPDEPAGDLGLLRPERRDRSAVEAEPLDRASLENDSLAGAEVDVLGRAMSSGREMYLQWERLS